MNQQSSQQQAQGQQTQQPQMQNRMMNLQPAQIQQLAKQCSFEFTEAKKLGLDTPAGQEHLKRAQRIKQVLVQYQQQQQQRGKDQQQQQQQPQQPQQQQQQQPQQQLQQQVQSPQIAPQPQAQTQLQQAQSQAQQAQQTQSPQISQQQAQVRQVQAPGQRSFSQQSPVSQQQQVLSNNGLNSSGGTASPSPMAQTAGAPNSQGTSTPNPQAGQKNPFQQLQQIKHVLSEFQKQLKAIDDAKKNAMLPPESLNKLLQKEQVLKDRYNSYKNVAINISQQIQKQQQLQQNFQQQPRSQSANQLPQDTPSSQAQSPALMPNAVQGQPSQQINSQQTGVNIPRSTSTTGIPRAQGQPVQNQNNNFQFHQQQQQSPPVTTQQIPQQQQAQNINQIQSQQQRQVLQQQQIPQQPSIGTPQQQQQQIPQAQAQIQIPNQAQQVRSNLQSRAGTPQPQAGSIAGRSASPNTPVTNVNAAAKPNGTNGNIINSAQGANVFKSSVPSIAVPNQINVKPPVPVSINQNRPSLTGGNGLSAPALTTPALVKLPPYEMQSDRVLSKRKLSELVKTVGADEGDGETTIDGDVEELLLDLADEFVTNITGFACRLAKHRKSENLDVKDVQLHLEKNWNIRIPGFSSDEIRSVRKWAPSSAHSQRISGIEISKSVDQNK